MLKNMFYLIFLIYVKRKSGGWVKNIHPNVDLIQILSKRSVRLLFHHMAAHFFK